MTDSMSAKDEREGGGKAKSVIAEHGGKAARKRPTDLGGGVDLGSLLQRSNFDEHLARHGIRRRIESASAGSTKCSTDGLARVRLVVVEDGRRAFGHLQSGEIGRDVVRPIRVELCAGLAREARVRGGARGG